MQLLDYSRSFVTFVTPGRANNARLQVEARCTLTDVGTGATEDYCFFASCKSEDTYAEKDLFLDPNYDFCGIFGQDEYVIFRAKAEWDADYAERGQWRNRFEDLVWQLREAPGASELSSNEEIVQATLEGCVLVGQTEFENRDGSSRACLEYPIKTMNVNDIRNEYQVDTGPLPFPDFEADAASPIDRFELAFVAFNVPGSADFIVQQETLARNGSVTVPHYSRRLALPVQNRIFRIEDR